MDYFSLLDHCQFCPANYEVLTIFSPLQTTYKIERIVSTLRKVETWLRSIMSENRLSGLYMMMNPHRKKININKDSFVENVINEFGIKKRNFQFLYSGNETKQ